MLLALSFTRRRSECGSVAVQVPAVPGARTRGVSMPSITYVDA